MPYLSKTTCNYSRCSKAVPHGTGYCSRHKKTTVANQKKSDPAYHNTTYRKRIDRYKKDHPFCDESNGHGCGKLIQTFTERELDHIIPWKDGQNEYERMKLLNDETNWQTLCKSCHSRKTRRES